MQLYPHTERILTRVLGSNLEDIAVELENLEENAEVFDYPWPERYCVVTKPDGKKAYGVRDDYEANVVEWTRRLREWLENNPRWFYTFYRVNGILFAPRKNK